jgi:acid stress-induced BolA-like protein IbaG/YrbA
MKILKKKHMVKNQDEKKGELKAKLMEGHIHAIVVKPISLNQL